MAEVVKFAKKIKLDVDKLLGDWIVCIPGFTLQKYRKLQRSKLSIFAVNCFGGCLSHALALPFRTPFVNLFLENEDFIKFLRFPRLYMEETPIYKKHQFSSDKTIYYPVGSIGDISINMMHYENFDEAAVKWDERKQKINWYNIFVIMWTEDEKILEEFDKLPYGKKVCCTSFKSTLDSAFYINPNINVKNRSRFVDIFLDFGNGHPFYYDPFDMLLYGKKTPLIDM